MSKVLIVFSVLFAMLAVFLTVGCLNGNDWLKVCLSVWEFNPFIQMMMVLSKQMDQQQAAAMFAHANDSIKDIPDICLHVGLLNLETSIKFVSITFNFPVVASSSKTTIALLVIAILLLIIGMCLLIRSACSQSESNERKSSARRFSLVGTVFLFIAALLLLGGTAAYMNGHSNAIHHPMQVMKDIYKQFTQLLLNGATLSPSAQQSPQKQQITGLLTQIIMKSDPAFSHSLYTAWAATCSALLSVLCAGLGWHKQRSD
uniref:Uncharacterized LOC100178130 n=1 Tax=Ciona intestinalis TaxID=7719 RepID=F6TYH2_CIOIN|nr:uncharacterized protein LOC100178130 [Ciona intestinalis]|eukprot:XP_002127375.1 uncharacterized protein LOC100178130 [Ciona intestinalis]